MRIMQKQFLMENHFFLIVSINYMIFHSLCQVIMIELLNILTSLKQYYINSLIIKEKRTSFKIFIFKCHRIYLRKKWQFRRTKHIFNV